MHSHYKINCERHYYTKNMISRNVDSCFDKNSNLDYTAANRCVTLNTNMK